MANKKKAIEIYKTYSNKDLTIAYVMYLLSDIHIDLTEMPITLLYALAENTLSAYNSIGSGVDFIDSFEFFIDCICIYTEETLKTNTKIKNNSDLYDVLSDDLLNDKSNFYQFYYLAQMDHLDNIVINE